MSCGCSSQERAVASVLSQCGDDIECIANACRESGGGVRCAHLAFAQIEPCMSYFPSISDIVYCVRRQGGSLDLIRRMLDAMPVRNRRSCDYAHLGISTAQFSDGSSYPAVAVINQESPSSRLFNLLYSLYDHRIYVELSLYPIRLYPNASRGTILITTNPINISEIPERLNSLDRDAASLYTSIFNGNTDALFTLLRRGPTYFLAPQSIPTVRDLLARCGVGAEDADYAYDGVEAGEEEGECAKLVGNIVDASSVVTDEMARRCGAW